MGIAPAAHIARPSPFDRLRTRNEQRVAGARLHCAGAPRGGPGTAIVTDRAAPAVGDRYGAGIACQLVAVLLFTVMASLIKALGGQYSTAQIVLFRSAPALLPLLLYLPSQGGWSALRTRRPALQALRAGAGLMSMFAGFHAIAHMQFADYVAISFTAPLFGTLLSIPLLGERVGVWRLGACIAGFSGILVMAGPSGVALDVYTGLAIASAFLYGLVMIAMRRLGGVDNSAATVFYFTAAGTVIGGGLAAFDWVAPPTADLVPLAAIGILGGVAQIFMTQAFRLAPPSVVAPFDYSAMVWALLIGWFAFGSFPTAQALIGAAIICAAGLFILYRETRRGTRRPPVKRSSL
jgi:drug/metabolite transporter (DMT)-like permease